jgi:hypothetical protein
MATLSKPFLSPVAPLLNAEVLQRVHRAPRTASVHSQCYLKPINRQFVGSLPPGGKRLGAAELRVTIGSGAEAPLEMGNASLLAGLRRGCEMLRTSGQVVTKECDI